MSVDILPFAVWQSGTNQNSIPANDNALRNEVLAKGALTIADAEPGSPSQRDVHVVGTAWGGFSTNDVVIYIASTWYGFAPFTGWLKRIGSDVYQYTGSAWEVLSGGGGASVPPVVTEPGTNLDATASNDGNYTRFTNAGAKTYTFDDAETFTAGDEYHGRNIGAGDLTITEAGTMTINAPAGGTLVIPQGGTFTVKIVAAHEADLFGVTVAA